MADRSRKRTLGSTMDPTRMTPLDTIEMPPRIKRLPVNKNGYPVPWFVEWIKGEPDFRVVDSRKVPLAIKRGKCWVCGEKRTGPTAAFVIGPMCAVNRISGEPPSHRDCAIYAAQVCPFLVNPKKRRREGGLDELDMLYQAEGFIARNPGVTLVWSGRGWKPFVGPGEVTYFNIGQPTRVEWYTEGRAATRDEVMEAIESGLPILREAAERDGSEAVAELESMLHEALPLVPS